MLETRLNLLVDLHERDTFCWLNNICHSLLLVLGFSRTEAMKLDWVPLETGSLSNFPECYIKGVRCRRLISLGRVEMACRNLFSEDPDERGIIL